MHTTDLPEDIDIILSTPWLSCLGPTMMNLSAYACPSSTRAIMCSSLAPTPSYISTMESLEPSWEDKPDVSVAIMGRPCNIDIIDYLVSNPGLYTMLCDDTLIVEE